MRVIGIIIVLMSGVAGSFFAVRELEKRLLNVRALCKLLRICAEQVEYFSRGSREILLSCDSELLRECGYYEETLPNSFFEFFDSCEILCKESRSIMLEFAGDFGKNYRDEQVKRCRYYLERMNERASELEAALPAQRKLAISLFVSATLMVIILLV